MIKTTEPMGWSRVDRALNRCRQQLANAAGEEDFQAIGLLCREILISLAEVVWDADRHPTLDGVTPSETDAKRKLEAYIKVELASSANEEIRKHARASLALAIALQHRRTAAYRDAAMCLEGTTAMVNLLSIVQGRHESVPSEMTSGSSTLDPSPAPVLTPEIADAAREFSINRINTAQMGGRLPTVLLLGPRLFLHLMPITAFQPGAEIDHAAMRRLCSRFKPAHYDRFEDRTTVEGWQLWQPRWQLPSPRQLHSVSLWCSMLTNQGITEIIETLEDVPQNAPPAIINGYPLERQIVETLDQLIGGYIQLGLTSPAILQVTLTDVLGVRLERSRPGNAYGFDRPTILLPELYIERMETPMGNLLRPLFDALWRAAGWSDGSQSFQRGEWAGYGDGRIGMRYQ